MTTEDKSQDQEILRIRDSLKGKVPWAVFVWALGLFVVAMGLIGNLAMSASSEASAAKDTIWEVKVKVEGIEKDVGWIRKYIEDGNKKSSSAKVTPSVFSSR